jgi:hypothetical protein
MGYAAKQTQKAQISKKKGLNKAKSVFRQSDKKTLIASAEKVFNQFIRLRDEKQPCISCGYAGNNRQWHAGHYRPKGRNSALRFDERNCSKQCSICNNHLSGNLVKYRENLIKKIGSEMVDELEAINTPKKWSVEELTQIIAVYKAKVKELE